MIMQDVLPGQQFYHIKYDSVAFRVLTPDNQEVSDDGLVPYAPNGKDYINWAYPTDEVKVL